MVVNLLWVIFILHVTCGKSNYYTSVSFGPKRMIKYSHQMIPECSRDEIKAEVCVQKAISPPAGQS